MHTPKAILLHLDGSTRMSDRVQVARQLAEDFDAQVTGLYATMPLLLRFPLAMDATVAAGAAMVEIDERERANAHDLFVAACAGSPRLSWSAARRDAFQDMTREALYADLLVLGQRNTNDPAVSELPPEFVANLLLDSGKPALVLPYAGPVATIGRKVLVAWKETRESARAITAALPWLLRAEQVHVVCYGKEVDESLRALQSYLAAHGIAATPHLGAPEAGNIGDLLLSEAADRSADLLVMGCYGHGRAREWVLGGATRTILQSMTLPVLMAH